MIRRLRDHELGYVKCIILAAVLLLGGCSSAKPPAPVFGFGSPGDVQLGAADSAVGRDLVVRVPGG